MNAPEEPKIHFLTIGSHKLKMRTIRHNEDWVVNAADVRRCVGSAPVTAVFHVGKHRYITMVTLAEMLKTMNVKEVAEVNRRHRSERGTEQNYTSLYADFPFSGIHIENSVLGKRKSPEPEKGEKNSRDEPLECITAADLIAFRAIEKRLFETIQVFRETLVPFAHLVAVSDVSDSLLLFHARMLRIIDMIAQGQTGFPPHTRFADWSLEIDIHKVTALDLVTFTTHREKIDKTLKELRELFQPLLRILHIGEILTYVDRFQRKMNAVRDEVLNGRQS